MMDGCDSRTTIGPARWSGLRGVEAISNGVPSLRRPEAKNAAATLVWMGVLLGSLFFGVSVLAHRLQPYPSEHTTVIAQLGLQVFGNGPLFVFLQFATATILVLAANTAYNGFPSLSSIIARDGFLPRQLMNRGDRLVFSNGIIMLAGAAALLLVAFGGITTKLIPLYAVGVFTSFTLSQTGMVRHHLRLHEPHWRRSAVLNAVGGVATLGEFTDSTLLYIEDLEHRWPNAYVNVIIPEFYVEHWWGHLLHNQSALILKGRWLFRKSTAVTSIPYRVERSPEAPVSHPS